MAPLSGMHSIKRFYRAICGNNEKLKLGGGTDERFWSGLRPALWDPKDIVKGENDDFIVPNLQRWAFLIETIFISRRLLWDFIDKSLGGKLKQNNYKNDIFLYYKTSLQ